MDCGSSKDRPEDASQAFVNGNGRENRNNKGSDGMSSQAFENARMNGDGSQPVTENKFGEPQLQSHVIQLILKRRFGDAEESLNFLADFNYTDQVQGYSPLLAAVMVISTSTLVDRSSAIEFLQYLLLNKAREDFTPTSGVTPVLFSQAHGLNLFPHVPVTMEHVLEAVGRNKLELLEVLLRMVDVNSEDADGLLPLNHAIAVVAPCRTGIVEVMFKAGADPTL